MPRKRKSALLTAAGVVCIIIGSLGLICGLCGAADTAMIVAGPTGGPVDMKAYLKREAPAWLAIAGIRAGALFLLSCLLLVAAVGMFQRQIWARWLAIGYALISLPLHLVHGIYGFAVYMPAMERFMMSANPGAKAPGFSSGFTIGFTATFLPPLIMWIAASVFLLIAMLSPQGGQAFAAPEPRRREYDDELDDDYDRPRRRRRDAYDDSE